MSTLHIGIEPADYDSLVEVLPTDVTIFRDGDSWISWGDPIGRSGHHGHTDYEHVVLRAEDATNLMADVSHFMSLGFLQVMEGGDHQVGTIATITHDDDWSEAIYNVIDQPARNALLDRKRERHAALVRESRGQR